jgi:hypothetical protein
MEPYSQHSLLHPILPHVPQTATADLASVDALGVNRQKTLIGRGAHGKWEDSALQHSFRSSWLTKERQPQDLAKPGAQEAGHRACWSGHKTGVGSKALWALANLGSSWAPSHIMCAL